MKRRFGRRAAHLLAEARRETSEDLEALHARQSAAGMLRSGNTARQGVEHLQQRSTERLRQALAEVGAAIEHRGRAWRIALQEIRSTLGEHEVEALAILEDTFMLAGIGRGTSQAAVDQLLAAVAESLRKQVDEFEQGWTAPVPKRWNERYPVPYALLLLVAGSAIGFVAARLERALAW